MFGLGLCCLGFIGYGVYKAYFAPDSPTTTQFNRARAIYYYYPQPHSTFGCSNVKVETAKESRILTNEIKK